MIDLLRRAWEALASFKQAYPENWNEDDEQVMKDLMRADLQLSGVKLKWQGLTADEIWACNVAPAGHHVECHICVAHQNVLDFAEAIEAKLREKNT